MKVKLGDIASVYPLLMKSSWSKMSGKAKHRMICILQAIKPHFNEFNGLREDTVKKLAGEDYQEAVRKIQNPPADLPEKEKDEALKLVRSSDEAYAKFMQETAAKEVEVDYQMLGEEDFEALLDGSKDLSPQELLLLSELISE